MQEKPKQGDKDGSLDQFELTQTSSFKDPWLTQLCAKLSLSKSVRNRKPAGKAVCQVTRRGASRRQDHHAHLDDQDTKMTATPIIAIERPRTSWPGAQQAVASAEQPALVPESSGNEPRESSTLESRDEGSQVKCEQAQSELEVSPGATRRPSQFEAVDEVRENFINLLRYNKLQSFYLGALIYSVINIALKFAWAPTILTSSPELSDPTLSSANFTNSTRLGKESQSFTCEEPESLVTLVAALSILPILLLIILAALRFARDDSLHPRTDTSIAVSATLSWLNTFGSMLVASHFYLFALKPTIVTSGSSRMVSNGSKAHLNSLVMLSYTQPLLFESAQSCRAQRLIGHLVIILPPTIYLWLALDAPSDSNEEDAMATMIVQLSILCVAVALGIYRRANFVKDIDRMPFGGANQLIEAKVSLEHQRQQQETLLLSVLPAYVAEQVKRNMLKKTNSTSSSTPSSSSAPPLSCATFPDTTSYPSSPTPAQSPPLALAGPFLRAHIPIERMSFSSANQRASFRRSSLQQQQRQTQQHQQTCALYLGQSSSATSSMLIPQSNVPQLPASVSSCNPAARRGFNELYIRTYNNVSLLYGDIVGFTRLCTQLSSSQLVRVLNDLFSRFDHLAEKHKIMRIKILGDCYYGVSGIPEFAVMGAKSRAIRNDNHAINCVNMGLDMIRYIRCFNIERASTQARISEGLDCVADGVSKQNASCSDCTGNTPLPEFELNMRIGVHTGHIHSGVIGLKKWQFDVWSNDVSIAMHCESSGKAGRVQVTEATRQQLNGAFSCEPVPLYKRDSFLVSRDVFTYLIKEPTQKLVASNSPTSPNTRTSIDLGNESREVKPVQVDLAQVYSRSTHKTGDDLDNIRKATIGTLRQTMLSSVEGCGSSLVGCTLSHHDLNAIDMTYREKSLDKLYLKRRVADPLLDSFMLLILLGLLLPLSNILFIPAPLQVNWPINLLIALSTTITLSLALFYSPSKLKPTKVSEPNLAEEIGQASLAAPLNISPDSFSPEAETINHFEAWPKHQVIVHELKSANLRARIEDYRKRLHQVFLTLVRRIAKQVNHRSSKTRCISANALFFLVITCQMYLLIYSSHKLKTELVEEEHLQLTVILLLVALDLSSNLLTYRCRVGIITILIIILLFMPRSFFTGSTKVGNAQGGAKVVQAASRKARCSSANDDQSSLALVFVFSLWSLIYARQLEYSTRTNFLWRTRLNVDHEELEYISGINKVLLENILPSHVVQYFLTQPGDQLKSHLSSGLRSPYMRMSKFIALRFKFSSNLIATIT